MDYSTVIKWFLWYHRLTTPYYTSQGRVKYIYYSFMAVSITFAVGSYLFNLMIPGFSRDFYFETLYGLIESVWILFTLVDILFKRHSLEAHLQFLDQPFHQFGPTFSHEEVIDEYTFAVKLIGFYYLVFNLFAIMKIGIPLSFFLMNYSQTEVADLPLPVGYIPVSSSSYVVFSLFFILGASYFTVLSLIFTNWAMAFAFGSVKLVAQLRMLNQSLMDLNGRTDQRFSVLAELSLAVAGTSGEDLYETCLYECLKECIQVHQKIISQRKVLEDTFTLSILMYTQAIVWHMAFQGIQLTTMNQFPPIGTLMLAILIVIVSFGQLFILSYCGQILINESENLHLPLYACPWIDKSSKFKKDLIIMRSVALRPLRVTAFGLYVLNMEFAYNSVCAAYSFFNVLLSIQKHD